MNINSLIYFIFLLLINLSIYADWEEVKIPYGNGYIDRLTVGEDYIVATERNNIYRLDLNSNIWELADISNEGNSYFLSVISFSDTVIAASDFGNLFSSNKGRTWSQMNKDINLFNITSLAKNNDYLFASTRSGYYRSKRSKIKWEKIEVPSPIPSNSLYASGSKLVVNELRSKDLGGGLYLSNDNGNSWTTFYKDQNVTNTNVFDDTVIVKVNSNLFISLDFGKTWKSKEITDDVRFIEVLNNEIYIFPNYGNIIKYNFDFTKKETITSILDKNFINSVSRKNNSFYIGTSSGMFIYESFGKKLVNNSPKSTFSNLFSITEYNNKLLVTGYNLGTKISDENGEIWNQLSKELDSIEISPVTFSISDGLFFGQKYMSSELIFSEDAISWKVFDNPSNALIKKQEIWNRNLFFFVNQDLYKSTDYGDSWVIIESLISDKGFPPIITTTSVVNDEFFVGTDGAGIYYSSSNGEDWIRTNFSDEIYKQSKVTKIIKNESKLYAILDNSYQNEFLLFEYIEEYNLWIRKSLLDNKPIRTFLNIGNALLWSTAEGVYLSNDDGISKTLFTEGLSKSDLVYINGMLVFNNYIYMINSNGIYRRLLSEFGITSVESEIERNYLYTYPPYPNPAKSEVKVLFYWDINLPMTTDDISIYDITGKKIDAFDKISLVKQANHYGNLIWDCSTAQPGIYLINIKQGTEEKAVKVVVE